MMVRNASNKAVIVDVLHLSVVRLAAAVHETLSPFMTEMREDLAAVKEKVDSLSRDLEEHKNKSTTELVDGLNMTVMTVNSELEHNVLTNVTKELKKATDYVLEQLSPYGCGGTGGWRRVVYLNMTDPNTNCPSGWNLTTYSNTKSTCGRNNVSDLSCDSVFFPVSEDTTLVCVALSEPTSIATLMHLRPIMMEQCPQLKEPMLLVSVSHMVVNDNTSGHLQLAILRTDPLGMMPVLVMLVSISPSHHLWVETISVSQESIQVLLVVFIQMILSGMVKAVVAAVAVAHSTILHTSLSNSPAPPLTL